MEEWIPLVPMSRLIDFRDPTREGLNVLVVILGELMWVANWEYDKYRELFKFENEADSK